MLQTINGFDLILIITIVGLIIHNRHLNRECESYVRQILKVSWELQELETKLFPSECMYCLGIEEMVTGNECYCEIPF